jgi:outer membrane receptor protein involved in Fe transport
MNKFFQSLLFVLIVTAISAQTGKISGTILDAKTGETLPGAMASVEGTGKGAIADFDGKFTIIGVPAGVVNLLVSYISYDSKKITGVVVKANDVTNVNISLDPSTSKELQEVEVVVTLNKENNTALVLQQKNNASVSDGISAETIKRSPDRSTGDVLKRVSGASIQDNKFAIVRGLNERYNAAYLNGAPLPSTESDRKAFSFDIFPANMLDNLVITKTARPDLPGEFAGGVIDITTKNIPEKSFFSFNAGGGYNTVATGKQQLYYKGGKKDWLGVDDGSRAIWKDIPAFENFPVDIHKQAELAKKLPTSDWGVYSDKNFAPNSSFQMSGGLNIKRKEKEFFGMMASLSYQNINNMIATRRISYLSGIPGDDTDPLLADKIYFDRNYQNQKLIGGLLNFGFKLNENNTISFKNLYSIYTDNRLIHRSGTTTPNELNPNMIRSFAMWFTQNNIYTTQLIGDHYLPNQKIKIAWNGSYSNVKRDIPNLRRHVYQKLTRIEPIIVDESEPPIINPYDTVYAASFGVPRSNSPDYSGVSLWALLNENIYSYKADVSRSFKINDDIIIEPKIGGFFQYRERDFNFRQFIYSPYQVTGGTVSFSNSIAYLPTQNIYTDANMGVITPSSSTNPQRVGGFLLSESTYPNSSYNANSRLIASYAMFDFKYKTMFRVIGGARFESYYQYLRYFDDKYLINRKVNTQDTVWNDLLPSINIVYSPNDKSNIRLSYSKTVNRPEFRELAPFNFYDFNINYSLEGNPTLQYCKIDNYDIRYEIFPGAGQLFSISGFYKKFVNPIEIFQSVNRGNLKYGNANEGYVLGTELEYRVNLGVFTKKDSGLVSDILNNTTIFSNLALFKSEIVGAQDYTYNRPLQGQSPYIINAGITYNDRKHNYSFSMMV